MFQSTPLREGRHRPFHKQQGGKACFNPRPSVRGDLLALHALLDGLEFQSTPLREGRPARRSPGASAPLFQSTPLREGRHIVHCGALFVNRFQSTPLRKGRLDRRNQKPG